MPFLDIFKENNIEKRRVFFSNPLVKWLWENLFITNDETFIMNYFRRVRSTMFEGEERYQIFMKDVYHV